MNIRYLKTLYAPVDHVEIYHERYSPPSTCEHPSQDVNPLR